MKGTLFSITLGGLALIVILQGVLFTSTSLQSQRLQKQVSELSQKFDDLDSTLSETRGLITKINSFIDEPLPESEDLSNLTTNDPYNLLSPENLAQTLGVSTTATEKTVRLQGSWNTIDVFETPKASSQVTGQLLSGKDYTVISKQQDWYQIKLNSLTSAWVSANFVYETN